MRTGRFFHRHAAGASVVAVAVVGALLIGGVANAAPPASTHVVTTAPTATSTALTASPASPVAQGTRVTLTAAVTPAEAAGTVQFTDGTTNIGAPVTVSNSTASGTTSTLTVGDHQLTAVFTPTDPAAFSSSTSPAVSLTVTESDG
ncbi:MAG: Ig-like domain-containing protein [Pseudonocardiaceae bacterium]